MSTSSHVAVNYHKVELEEQNRRGVDDLKVAVRSEEANERGDAHEPKPRIPKRRRSLPRVPEARKSNQKVTAHEGRKGDRESVSLERCKRRSMQRVLGARNSNPIATSDGRCEQKNTERTDVKDKKTAGDGTRGPMKKRAVPTTGKNKSSANSRQEQEQCQQQARKEQCQQQARTRAVPTAGEIPQRDIKANKRVSNSQHC